MNPSILDPESHTAKILAFMSLPGHLLFYFAITRIKLWQSDHLNAATLTPSFISFYISISVLQVGLFTRHFIFLPFS